MNLHDLSPPDGSNEESRRKGRGRGAKQGEKCGRGTKGQKKRNQIPIYFEGGQTPIYRRFPKRGFNHHVSITRDIVNVGSLSDFEAGAEVTPDDLEEKGLVNEADSIKLLGDGEISVSLTVCVHEASQGATEKIESAGGEIELLTSDSDQEN